MFGNLTVFTVPSEIGIQYDETGYELNEQQIIEFISFMWYNLLQTKEGV